MDNSIPREIFKWDGQRARLARDDLAAEEPLEIRLRGRPVTITMRTPGHDAELAAGFLLTEGIIHLAGDIVRCEHCGRNEAQNVLNVVLSPDVHVDFNRLTRHVFASSSCGICGRTTIDAICTTLPAVTSDLIVGADLIQRMPDLMRCAQQTFDRTGGLHAAAVFNEHGELLVLREDIGRHNAVDKVIGYCLLRKLLPLDRHVLVVSGRSSFEILQKALAARIAIVAAVSAPSSLAVDLARQSGQTLIGFLRDGRMNIYSHARRIDTGFPALKDVPLRPEDLRGAQHG